MDIPWFIHSPVDGHLNCFQFLSVKNKTKNIVKDFIWTYAFILNKNLEVNWLNHTGMCIDFDSYNFIIPVKITYSRSFGVDSVGFSVVEHVIREYSLTSFFPIRMTFFFPLIALNRTSSTVLSNSGGSGPPCLVTDFKGKV